MSASGSNISVEDLRTFHDAELTSIALDRTARRVLLSFLRDDGTKGRFECEGVRNIKCSTLLLQNVVSRLLVVPALGLKVEEVQRIIAWSFTLDNRLAISPETLATNAANVMAGELQLFYVDPSWGAELAVLCGSVVLKAT
jgi:hypothetical protein